MEMEMSQDKALIEHARYSLLNHHGRILAMDRQSGGLYEWSDARSEWVVAAPPLDGSKPAVHRPARVGG